MLSVANENDFNINNGLVVLKFWATWCAPCKVFTPVVAKLDEEFESINFFSVDIDQVPTLARKHKVKSLPTLVVLEDGEEIDRIVGQQMIKPLRTQFRKISKQDQEEIDVVAQEA